jgi:hypothetical protein
LEGGRKNLGGRKSKYEVNYPTLATTARMRHPARNQEMYNAGMKKPAPVKSPFSELYQLHLDVEQLAHELRDRNKKGWAPLRKHVDKLYNISMKLRILDKQPRTRF